MKKLGNGAFGEVWLAKDLHDSKKSVAIKLIQVQASRNRVAYTLFGLGRAQRKQLQSAQKEVHVLQKLNHPNVVEFFRSYDYKSSGGKVGIGIVTEFCTRGDLDHYVRELNYQERTSAEWQKKRLRWFKELGHGLQYIHSIKILHRDIKPCNILITNTWILKIADVGIAKSLYDVQSEGAGDEGYNVYMTSIRGFVPFMAPELFQKNYVPTEKSDVFALGLVFVLMTNDKTHAHDSGPVVNWQGETPLGMLQHHREDVRHLNASQLLSPFMALATPREIKLIDRMLVYDYHNRLSASDVVEEIEIIEKHVRDSSVRVLTESPVPSRKCKC